jgi:hypothetical protein
MTPELSPATPPGSPRTGARPRSGTSKRSWPTRKATFPLARFRRWQRPFSAHATRSRAYRRASWTPPAVPLRAGGAPVPRRGVGDLSHRAASGSAAKELGRSDELRRRADLSRPGTGPATWWEWSRGPRARLGSRGRRRSAAGPPGRPGALGGGGRSPARDHRDPIQNRGEAGGRGGPHAADRPILAGGPLSRRGPHGEGGAGLLRRGPLAGDVAPQCGLCPGRRSGRGTPSAGKAHRAGGNRRALDGCVVPGQ